MNPLALAEALANRGVESGEIEPKRVLFDRVLTTFSALASRQPTHVWWLPGRLEVFGKHTDYAGGRTLVGAVPRGFIVAAGARQDRTIQVADARTGDGAILDAHSLDERLTDWKHYAEVVARRLARNFPDAPIGTDIVFASDLPPAAGMSSSSALMVGIATAIVRVAGIQSRPEWQTNIKSRLEAAGYYACIENGMSFGTLAGDEGVGTHGGSEDHAAILTSEARTLSAFAFVPMRSIGSVRVPDDWRFVVASSGIAAEKTGAARDRYNRLSLAARAALEIWNREHAAESLAAALGSSQAALPALRRMLRAAGSDRWTPDALERRVDHFVREDARIPGALAAFAAGDRALLGELSGASQSDAEALLENQVPETVALAKRARSCGAFAACSFGAGFGGSVWALVDRDQSERFRSTWHPEAFFADPAPGLVELI